MNNKQLMCWWMGKNLKEASENAWEVLYDIEKAVGRSKEEVMKDIEDFKYCSEFNVLSLGDIIYTIYKRI